MGQRLAIKPAGQDKKYFAHRSLDNGARKPWRLRRMRRRQSARERNWPHDRSFGIPGSCLPAGSRLGNSRNER